MTTVSTGPGEQYNTFTEQRSNGTSSWNLLYGGSGYTHSGGDTPGFHRRKRRGDLLPVNHFTSREWSIASLTGSWSWTNDWDSNYWAQGNACTAAVLNWPIFAPPEMKATWISSINYDYLSQSALAGLDNTWDALTFFGELKDVRRLFTNIVWRFNQTLLDLASRRTFAKGVADAFIEKAFGWDPLIRDLDSISQFLTAGREKRAFYRQTRSLGASFSETSVREHNQTEMHGTWTCTHSATLSARSFAISRIAAPVARFDIPVTLWELTSFSWLVDYIYDIGRSLDSIAAYNNHPDVILGSGYMLTIESTGSFDCTVHSGWHGYSSSFSSTREVIKSRWPQTPSIAPHYTFSDATVGQALNALGVGIQRFFKDAYDDRRWMGRRG
jgi:hypothetical protein